MSPSYLTSTVADVGKPLLLHQAMTKGALCQISLCCCSELRTPKQKNGKRSPSRRTGRSLRIHDFNGRVVISCFQILWTCTRFLRATTYVEATKFDSRSWSKCPVISKNWFCCLQHVTEGEMHAIVNRQSRRVVLISNPGSYVQLIYDGCCWYWPTKIKYDLAKPVRICQYGLV